jgi:hypothetical protein
MRLFLTGLSEDTVYKISSCVVEELQQEMSAGVISISEETRAAVVQNF